MIPMIWNAVAFLAFTNNLLNIDPSSTLVHRIPSLLENVLGISQTLDAAKQIYGAATLKWSSAEDQLTYCDQLEDTIFSRQWAIPSEAAEAIQFAPWIPPMLLCEQISRHDATDIVPWNIPNFDWLRSENGTARIDGLADWTNVAALLRRANKNMAHPADALSQMPFDTIPILHHASSFLDTMLIAFVGKKVETVPLPAEDVCADAPIPEKDVGVDLKTQCPRSLALEIQRLCPSGGDPEFFEADGLEIPSPLFQLLFWAPVMLGVITALAAVVYTSVSLRKSDVATAKLSVPSFVVLHECGEVDDHDRDCLLDNDVDSDKHLSLDAIVSPASTLSAQAVLSLKPLPSVGAIVSLPANETVASTKTVSLPDTVVGVGLSGNEGSSPIATASIEPARRDSPPITSGSVALACTVARITSPYTPPARLLSPALPPRLPTSEDESHSLPMTACPTDIGSSHTSNQEPEIVSLSLPALNRYAAVFVPSVPARCSSPAERRQKLLLQLLRKFEEQFASHVYLNALVAHPDVMNRFYTFCVDLQEQNPCDMDAFNELVLADQMLRFINKDAEGRTIVIKAFACLIGPLTSIKFVPNSPWSPERKFLAVFEEDEDLEDPRRGGNFDFLDDGGYSLVDNKKHAAEWDHRIKEFRNKLAEQSERMEEFTLPQLKAFCESNRLDMPQKAYSGQMRLMGYGTRRLQRARFRGLIDQDAFSSSRSVDERRALAENFMALDEDWQAGCLIQDHKGHSQKDIEDIKNGKKSFEVWLRFFLDYNDQRPKLTTENLADLDAQSGDDSIPREDDAVSDTSSDQRFMDEIKAMGEADSKTPEASTSDDTLGHVSQLSAVLPPEEDQPAPTPVVASAPVEPAPEMTTEEHLSPLLPKGEPVAKEGVVVNGAGTINEDSTSLADSPVPPSMDEADAWLAEKRRKMFAKFREMVHTHGPVLRPSTEDELYNSMCSTVPDWEIDMWVTRELGEERAQKRMAVELGEIAGSFTAEEAASVAAWKKARAPKRKGRR